MVVSNTQKSLEFYSRILGMQQMKRPDLGFPGAWLAIGPQQQLHLLELENMDPVTGRPDHGGRDRHVAMTVKSLAAIKQLLDNAGIRYSLSKSGRKALFCRDPDANAIEIIELE
jgi:glyoxylase I family protein